MLNFLSKIGLRNKILISLGLFMLILGGLVYFIILPTIKEINRIENEIENQRIDLEKRYIRGQSLRELTENFNKIEPQLDILDQIFVKKDNEQGLEFITTLESIAEKNNIMQKINLDTTDSNKEQNYQTKPIKITAQGNYIDIIRYLIDIESLNYYININKINLFSSAPTNTLAAPEENKINTPVNLTIEGNTFWK